MKIVFLTKWKPEVTQAQVEEALRVADDSFAKGPLLSYEHGLGKNLAVGDVHQADWGFILELEPENFQAWRESDAHEALGQVLRRLAGERITIEF